MKSRQNGITLKKLKPKEVEKIIGLRFDEVNILKDPLAYIENAILSGSTDVLNVTISQLNEVKGHYHIKDEKSAKHILLEILYTGNHELLEIFLDKIIDPRMDILNKDFFNIDRKLLKDMPRKIHFISPLTFVLNNNFLDTRETEELALSLIENGAEVKTSTTHSKLPIHLKLAINGLYPNVVKKILALGISLPDIRENAQIIKDIDASTNGLKKFRKRANQIKEYITNAQLENYFENTLDDEAFVEIADNRLLKRIVKDMLLNNCLKKKDISNLSYMLEDEDMANNFSDFLVITALKTRNVKILKTILELTNSADKELEIKERDELFDGIFNTLGVTNLEKITPLMIVLSAKDTPDSVKEEMVDLLINDFSASIGEDNPEYAKQLINLALKNNLNDVATKIFNKTHAIVDISNNKFTNTIKKSCNVAINLDEIRTVQLKMHLKERFSPEQIEKITNNKELKEFFTNLAYKDFDNFEENIDKIDMGEFGAYMLERAIMSKSTKNIEKVISKGVDINKPLKVYNDEDFDEVRECGNTEVTPLMFAITMESLSRDEKDDVIKLLVSKGADVNKSADVGGMSPLHYAALFKLKNSVHLLIDNGASLNSLDENGLTGLTCVKRCFTVEEKEKILKLALERREKSIYQNIQDKISSAIKAKHLDTREYIANLLDMHTNSRTVVNDIKLLGHLYSLDGKQEYDKNDVRLEGWDGGGHVIVYRLEMLLKLAREIEHNNYAKHMMGKISKENLLDLIKSEILNEYYVINGELNIKDSFSLEGYPLKKHNQSIAKVYADKIKTLKPHETFSLHLGTRGHAIYMVFERMENGRLQASRYNVGQGSRFHRITNDNKIKPYIVELPENDEGLDFFLKTALDWDKIDISSRPHEYKRELLEFFENIGGRRIDDGVAMKPQTVGNCSLKSDTVARVGRIYQKLKVQNKDLENITNEKLQDLAKNVCRFIKNYEREYARNLVVADGVLTQSEISKKVDECTIKRYAEILSRYIPTQYDASYTDEEINVLKREMINFLKKRVNFTIADSLEYTDENLDYNLHTLLENLDGNIEYIKEIKNMSKMILKSTAHDKETDDRSVKSDPMSMDCDDISLDYDNMSVDSDAMSIDM